VHCDRWQVVAVPFPFSERPGAKRRPALVLSNASFNRAGHTVLAMITTAEHAPWPGDTPLEGPQAAGLHVSCLVRLKLFTLDNRLIQKRLGALIPTDVTRVEANLKRHLP
jgi:mRNA interferase MazF